MDSWQRFDETLPNKEAFHSNPNMEDITDVDSIYQYANMPIMHNKTEDFYKDIANDVEKNI